MKLLITIAIAALAALITPHVVAAEAPAPMTLSLVTRTNDAAGRLVIRFRLSSTAGAPYNYYYLTQVPKEAGIGWEFARTEYRGAAILNTLKAGETATIEVAPPRGAARWRLWVRYNTRGGLARDAYIKSEEVVER